MKILNAIGAATLLFVALMLSSTASASQDACDHGGNHVIQVRVGDDGEPVLKYRGKSGEEVHVCQGDNVKWVLIGSNRQFSVDFFDGVHWHFPRLLIKLVRQEFQLNTESILSHNLVFNIN